MPTAILLNLVQFKEMRVLELYILEGQLSQMLLVERPFPRPSDQ